MRASGSCTFQMVITLFSILLLRSDVKRFKDVRKDFERSSESLETALWKNAQAPRGKQHEVEEASQSLLMARKGFRSDALDYVLQVHTQTHALKHIFRC